MQSSVRRRDDPAIRSLIHTHRSLGFSFSGEVREPFPAVIEAMEQTQLPVTSVDAPSSWNIEEGPPKSGLGSTFHPTALISLTAPKPLVKYFKGRHFIGGRCVPLDNLLQAAAEIFQVRGAGYREEVRFRSARVRRHRSSRRGRRSWTEVVNVSWLFLGGCDFDKGVIRADAVVN